MSYDRATRRSQIDQATDSMASHGWTDATTDEPLTPLPPVRTSDMMPILDDVKRTRNHPTGHTHSASEFGFGAYDPKHSALTVKPPVTALGRAAHADASPRVVQRKETGARPTGDVHAQAERGTSGSGGRLPHVDTIQRLFVATISAASALIPATPPSRYAMALERGRSRPAITSRSPPRRTYTPQHTKPLTACSNAAAFS